MFVIGYFFRLENSSGELKDEIIKQCTRKLQKGHISSKSGQIVRRVVRHAMHIKCRCIVCLIDRGRQGAVSIPYRGGH